MATFPPPDNFDFSHREFWPEWRRRIQLQNGDRARQRRGSACVDRVVLVGRKAESLMPFARIRESRRWKVIRSLYHVIWSLHAAVDRTFDWKRVDLNKVVYAYRHKQENPNDQMAHYRGRTTVNLDDLSRGNMTLQISSVQLADTGPYSCFVPKLETSCVTDLTVVEQVTSTTRPPPDEPSNPDGDNRQLIAIVPSTVVGIVIIICVLVGVLVRRGMI
ncbi:uncharacterized protein LOC119919174 [Micropterus salmoides]|uniref:uncharacterized protein LOC119919174 n=1 Tax=Micropterus salmoides TaxID=27706 RepID=UPI0018EBB2F9|nr:uncharacterized protein LOC119919174 [Micropterus salmoides]